MQDDPYNTDDDDEEEDSKSSMVLVEKQTYWSYPFNVDDLDDFQTEMDVKKKDNFTNAQIKEQSFDE